MDVTTKSNANDQSLPCFMLPTHAEPIIVPSVTVAEVVQYRPPEPLSGAPSWFIGTIEWRSVTIPVVSFERFNHIPESQQGMDPRIAIMNVVSNQHYMRFFAILVQGGPKPAKVLPQDMKKQDDSMSDGIAMKVLYGDQSAMIPDMDAIERAILTCHQWSKRFNIQESLPDNV